MRATGRAIWAGLLALGVLGAGTARAEAVRGAELKWKTLSELDRFEPFAAQAFHAGHLWSGRSRKDLAADYHLDVFAPDGSLVTTRELPHSLRHLYPYGPGSVLAVGVALSTQLTHYTIATLRGNRLELQSAKIPLGAFADEWAGRPGRLLFTDPGGLDDGSPIGKPLKTLFTLSGGAFRYLPARIRGPHQPILVGNALYVVEHPSIGSGGRSLLRVDPAGERTETIVTGADLAYVRLLGDGRTLALADRGGSEVLLVDTGTGKLTKRISVAAGAPRAVDELGRCLVVAAEQEKKVTFLDRTTGAVVADWDLAPLGARLTGIRSLSVDAKSGRIYVRSAYAANPMAAGGEERNGVFLVEEPSQATWGGCR